MSEQATNTVFAPNVLAGKVALVSGASRGLGQQMAFGLARAGAHVIGVARTPAGLEETCSVIEEAGGKATAIQCDVSSEDSVDQMSALVSEQVGRVDVLVNNAGIAWERQFADLTLDEFTDVLNVNVVGTFLMSRAIGRQMCEHGGGKIINIGSLFGIVGAPAMTHYCASKGAVIQLTRALAAEWAKFGVSVNCLCPGFFSTDVNAERLREPAVRDKLLGRIPMRRFGRFDEIVGWAVFLSTAASDYMTGQVLPVDGGWSAR